MNSAEDKSLCQSTGVAGKARQRALLEEDYYCSKDSMGIFSKKQKIYLKLGYRW